MLSSNSMRMGSAPEYSHSERNLVSGPVCKTARSDGKNYDRVGNLCTAMRDGLRGSERKSSTYRVSNGMEFMLVDMLGRLDSRAHISICFATVMA